MPVPPFPNTLNLSVASSGVLSGKGRGAPLDNYISAAPNDQTLVFVVS